jgi:uncharacterized protein YbjT (DUF2867 family)
VIDPMARMSLEDERLAKNMFEFELAYIKAIPYNTEPAFVLVSCAGDAERQIGRRLELKRKGEAALRLSGVAYTIVRPGAMVQEPGGYKALVFDQGNRIERVRARVSA